LGYLLKSLQYFVEITYWEERRNLVLDNRTLDVYLIMKFLINVQTECATSSTYG